MPPKGVCVVRDGQHVDVCEGINTPGGSDCKPYQDRVVGD